MQSQRKCLSLGHTILNYQVFNLSKLQSYIVSIPVVQCGPVQSMVQYQTGLIILLQLNPSLFKKKKKGLEEIPLWLYSNL